MLYDCLKTRQKLRLINYTTDEGMTKFKKTNVNYYMGMHCICSAYDNKGIIQRKLLVVTCL